MIYLAVNYGYEGWQLKEYVTAQDALDEIKKGGVYGEWKILQVIKVHRYLYLSRRKNEQVYRKRKG